ncbi:MAG: fused MFS/spermidine synthase [Phycisphaerales bacterium]
MIVIYSLAIFVAAALLFAVQPMTAKGLLPLLGGSPSVWTTCMLFFQGVLLAGYAYAHLVTTRLGRLGQLGVHLPVVLLGLAAGWWALGLRAQPPREDSPIPWLLMTLALMVGPAFFALSSAGPLLQRWFSATGHKRANDPYFLYAASNAGSMLGLLSYPFLIEPAMALGEQRRAWLGGFVLFVLLVGVCGVLMARKRSGAPEPAREPNPVPVPPPEDVRERGRSKTLERLAWIALAFIPSSLLLGVTTYISTDVAAIPLLWVLPLALYLLSFIIAFGGRADRLIRWLRYPAAVAIVVAALIVLFYVEGVVVLSIGLHLTAFTLAATFCHASLAARRPRVERLTEFYLLLSVGGALGGVFNAIVATALFPDAWEYPIALILAAAALPWAGGVTGLARPRGGIRWSSVVRFAPPVVLTVYMVLAVTFYTTLDASAKPTALLVLVVVPAVIALTASRDGLSLALCLLAIAGVRVTRQLTDPNLLLMDRTFFGVHRVVMGEEEVILRDDNTGFEVVYPVYSLYHGSTRHGDQIQGHPELSRIPSTYFHPTGPLGDIFGALQEREGPRRIGILGLGAGSMAAYGRPGDHITYFEIDPLVVHIARDSGRFTYLRDTPARVDIELGDGRLRLAEHPDGEFDLLIFDAFSGDAVPVHLVSVEAIALYRAKVKPGGLVVMNISNRRLNLAPIVANACARLGLAGALRDDQVVTDLQAAEGKLPSSWTVLAGAEEDLAPIAARSPGWWRLEPVPDKPTWTDEFSSITDVMIWRR